MRDEEKDQLLLDIAEKYKVIYEERNELGKLLKEFEGKHNEMMGLLIGMINQYVEYSNDLGWTLLLKKEHMPSLAVSEYRIKWVDVPEEEAIRLEVKHYTDN